MARVDPGRVVRRPAPALEHNTALRVRDGRVSLRMPLRICSLLAALALGGCANYQAVTGFAGETAAMTGAVRQ